MNREKELINNTVILAIGNFFPKLLVFITLPIMTEWLTKENYGTFDLAVSLCALAMPAVTLQIQSSAFRFLIDARQDMNHTKAIITNILAFTVLSSVFGFIIVFIITFKFTYIVRLLIAIYCFADIYVLTLGMITRGIGKNVVFTIGSIINGVINAILLIFLLTITKSGLNGVLIASITACVVTTVFYWIKINCYKMITPNLWNKKLTAELLGYSWPMVPNNLSQWILKLSDRLIIAWVLGIEANAIYAVANKIPDMLSIAKNIIIMAWHENASITKNDPDADIYYSLMFERFFKLFACVFLWIATFAPILFKILIHGSYAEAYPQVSVLLMAAFFNVMSSFQGGIYIAHMKTKNVGISTMIAAGINLVVNIVLINHIGLWAASLSTLVAYFTLFLYRMFNVKKFQKINYQYSLIIIILVFLASSSCLSVFRQFWSVIICCLIALVCSILLLKDIYIPMIKYFEKKIKALLI